MDMIKRIKLSSNTSQIDEDSENTYETSNVVYEDVF